MILSDICPALLLIFLNFFLQAQIYHILNLLWKLKCLTFFDYSPLINEVLPIYDMFDIIFLTYGYLFHKQFIFLLVSHNLILIYQRLMISLGILLGKSRFCVILCPIIGLCVFHHFFFYPHKFGKFGNRRIP